MRTRAPRHFAAKLVLAGIGGIVVLFREEPVIAAVLAGVAVVILVVIAANRPKPRQPVALACTVCGQSIAKTYYTGTYEGAEAIFCPNCARRIRAKKSRESVDGLSGPPPIPPNNQPTARRPRAPAKRTIMRPGEARLPD